MVAQARRMKTKKASCFSFSKNLDYVTHFLSFSLLLPPSLSPPSLPPTTEGSTAMPSPSETTAPMSPTGERPHRSKPVSGTSGLVRPTKWTEREVQRHKMEQIKAKEREMRESKEDAERSKREARLQRKQKKEERERLELMGRKVSRTGVTAKDASTDLRHPHLPLPR